jgi:hypothetical protein
MLRWRPCSTWHMFFRKSFTDSITARFPNSILSLISISLFFICFRSLVINGMPFLYKRSNSPWELYPRSPKSFPFSSRHNRPMTSMVPAVRQKEHSSPLSMQGKAVKPPGRASSPRRPGFEHCMAPDMAHFQKGSIDKTDAGTHPP